MPVVVDHAMPQDKAFYVSGESSDETPPITVTVSDPIEVDTVRDSGMMLDQNPTAVLVTGNQRMAPGDTVEADTYITPAPSVENIVPHSNVAP